MHGLSATVVSAGQGRLLYDDLRKSLSFKGMFDEKTALPPLATAAAGEEPLLKAFAALAKKTRQTIDPFFASNPNSSRFIRPMSPRRTRLRRSERPFSRRS